MFSSGSSLLVEKGFFLLLSGLSLFFFQNFQSNYSPSACCGGGYGAEHL